MPEFMSVGVMNEVHEDGTAYQSFWVWLDPPVVISAELLNNLNPVVAVLEEKTLYLGQYVLEGEGVVWPDRANYFYLVEEL